MEVIQVSWAGSDVAMGYGIREILSFAPYRMEQSKFTKLELPNTSNLEVIIVVGDSCWLAPNYELFMALRDELAVEVISSGKLQQKLENSAQLQPTPSYLPIFKR